jgi:hypothetical protein
MKWTEVMKKNSLLMVVAVTVYATSLLGQDFVWTQTSAPNTYWTCIASSSDGTKLAAAVDNFGSGGIYTSTDSGLTWTHTSGPNAYWGSIVSSSDGTILAAAANGGFIYTSANSGLTWTQTSAPSAYWSFIASSSDGTKLAAVFANTGGTGTSGAIYTSTDSGLTWTQTSAPELYWFSIASSSDGSKLAAAVANGGGIYTSTNSGLTWTQTSAPNLSWFSIASSSDGTKLAAAVRSSGIYTSTNSGLTWIQASAPNQNWQSIASSSDGTILAAAVFGGGIYTSVNSGLTWIQTSAPNLDWYSIASSSDGTKLTAAVFGGDIYIGTITQPSITAQPQSLAVNAHDTASFSVTALGAPPLSYQWSLNGSNISGAIASSLTISNVVQCDLGTYAVVVTNDFGTNTSSNAVLSMYPFLAAPFTGAVTYWGQSSTLSVRAWGTGPLDYQWFYDGVAISDATNQELTLTTIQATNAGLYSVVVTSPLGSVTNAAAQVVVEPAGVSLGFSPTLTISGVVGYNYIIQSTSNLLNTNGWVTLTNLTLTQPVQIWVDTNVNASSPFYSTFFYQVLPGQ